MTNTNATSGPTRAGQHHRHDHTRFSEPLGYDVGDRKRRSAIVHEFAEHATEQK
jgi:hypothetical protein